MKYYYDLHIHTCLSPCGDILMTPNNILNMAYLKELDIIAITDHNSTLQLPSIMELSSSYNMLVIPGVEVSTKEGYHVVCLFKSLNDANAFQSVLENFLNKTLYDKNMYGEQQILDVNDEVMAEIDYHLPPNTNLNVDRLNKVVKKIGGLLILAHPHKYKNLEISDEFIAKFDGIEVNKKDPNHVYNLQKKNFNNSDAHQITDISERESYIELDELSIDAFFKYMES